MISKEEIQKLANLARVDVSEEEAEGLRGDMTEILGYVSQVSEIAEGIIESEVGVSHNVMREDSNPTPTGSFSKEILEDMPKTENGYLKVKKIL